MKFKAAEMEGERMRWYNVNDKIPKEYETVLTGRIQDGFWQFDVCVFNHGRFRIFGDYDAEGVEFWTPIENFPGEPLTGTERGTI